MRPLVTREDAEGTRWPDRWDAAPLIAAAVAVLFQRRLHHGVELGLLALIAVGLALPLVRRALDRALGDDPATSRAVAAAFVAAGLAAAVAYPLPRWIAPALALLAVAPRVARGVAMGWRSDRLGAPDLLALTLLVLGNLALRASELRQVPIGAFYTIPDELARAPWRLLLPVDVGGGAFRWSSTGLIVVSALNAATSPVAVFLALNATLIVVAFACAWSALRSKPFAFTLAVCAGYGTQFHYAYVNASCVILYLFWCYLLVNLLAAYKLVTGATSPARWRAAFVGSLVVTALCWEMWLDYAAFLLAATALAWARPEVDRRALRAVAAPVLALLVAYVPAKVVLGGAREHLGSAREAELVVTYLGALPAATAVTLAAEDVATNALTYNHIALTSFLPPMFVYSSALPAAGAGAILEQQGHAARSAPPGMGAQLVLAHYRSSWRFMAGALSLALYAALASSIRRWLRDGAAADAARGALLLLVALGASTHLLIKFRFYNLPPVFSYKCVTAIVGAALLVAAGVAAIDRTATLARSLCATGAVWLIIIYGAFTRPALLTAMYSDSGMGQALIPGPSLARLFAP
jgi:hypothetical protein